MRPCTSAAGWGGCSGCHAWGYPRTFAAGCCRMPRSRRDQAVCLTTDSRTPPEWSITTASDLSVPVSQCTKAVSASARANATTARHSASHMVLPGLSNLANLRAIPQLPLPGSESGLQKSPRRGPALLQARAGQCSYFLDLLAFLAVSLWQPPTGQRTWAVRLLCRARPYCRAFEPFHKAHLMQ